MKDIEILEQLKRKYDAEMVSALVGAGFTKNIYPKASSWEGLLFDLVSEAYKDELEEMYNQYFHQKAGVDVQTFAECLPDFVKKIISRYGHLKVVSKYIEKKGCREALDYYVETHTPYFYKLGEGQYGLKGNSEVALTNKDLTTHQRFLKGKWQYVFTTNYDNALEFVNEVFDMGYLTIKSDYEMSRKKMARSIIKIHGSLVPVEDTMQSPFCFDNDHSRRYIISKADFDTYFQKHEAFSYLLRVALLSGSYCLLGFSGEDPNFKSWLNWVKDILDKDQSYDNNNIDRSESKENILKDGEDNIKVFLVLTGQEEIPIEKQLYYKNHHIGVIRLEDPDIRLKLRYSKNASDSTKIDSLLRYLVGNDTKMSKDQQMHQQKEDIHRLWRRIYSKLDNNETYEDDFQELKRRRTDERFLKDITWHDYIYDKLRRKADLSDTDKELLAFAVKDLGLFAKQIPSKWESYLKETPGWDLYESHQETLEGEEVLFEDSNDESVYENILRSLYHMNFESAKQILSSWQPPRDFLIAKCSLNHFFDRKDSLKELDSIILNPTSESEKYLASYIYNCIDSSFMPTYTLNDFRNQGLVGMNDSLMAIVKAIKDEKVDLQAYGTEETVIKMDGTDDNSKLVKAQEFLQLISREGFNLCYYNTSFINVADWYQVFRQIYTYLPYPCLYYSSQYNNRKVLSRIGQDFAYEEKLQDVLPDLLHRIICAVTDDTTPGQLMNGLFQIGRELFWGINENVWFEEFHKYLQEVFVKEEGRYIYSDDALRFVKNAFVCLHEEKHIRDVFSVTLDYWDKKPDEALSLIVYYLRINKIKALTEIQKSKVQAIANGAEFNLVSGLLYSLYKDGILDEEIKNNFIEKTFSDEDYLNKCDNYGLYDFCMLTAENSDNVTNLKPYILARNIWDCGIEGTVYSSSHRGSFPVVYLGDAYEWTDDEIRQIYDNLKMNLDKIKVDRLNRIPFLLGDYTDLLANMLLFADKYPHIVTEDTRKDILFKLNYARHYDSIENALYSDVPQTVSDAATELNAKFREGLYQENRRHFEIMINKCTMQKSPGITDCLVAIGVALHFCKEKVGNDKTVHESLYRLLLQYKDKDLRDLDLRVINAGHSLIEIAKFLKEVQMDDDNVNWWLNNKNLQRLNFLEYV